jgi:ribonuclease HI
LPLIIKMKLIIDPNKILKVYTDGAARGNPGPAACAFIVVQSSKILFSDVEYINRATNNVAEYNAIINALNYVKEAYSGEIEINSDSNLAIQQINGKWKINYPHLAKLQKEVLEISRKFKHIRFTHVPRENHFIKKCDELCNRKLDEQL